MCLDCGIDTGKAGEYYMLVDSVWLSICGTHEGMLCIGCIERRLGRRLTSADFITAYINRVGFGTKSARLVDRLATKT